MNLTLPYMTIFVSFHFRLKVLDMSDGSTAFETPKQKTLYIKFSPKNTYLACWELFFTTPQLPEGFDNFEIFDIKSKTVVKKLKHKKQSAW